MKNLKGIIALSILLVVGIVSMGTTNFTKNVLKTDTDTIRITKKNLQVNMFVTHGHCSTPFGGRVANLELAMLKRNDLGNPLENLKLSFNINPNTFTSCASSDITAKIRTPGLFVSENETNITFTSTEIYTMGLDWYQINGMLSIKGVEKPISLFMTGIRDTNQPMASILVVEGQLNLLDWGIDYDNQVNNVTSTDTKWMYLNMTINLS